MTQRIMREVRAVVSEFTSDFEISITGRCHIQITLRNGNQRRKIYTGGTPSDNRNLKNLRGHVRRAFKSFGRA